MLKKIFREPNKVLKIVTAVLIATAILGCLIWILVENINLRTVADDMQIQNHIFNGLMQNKVLIALIVVSTALCIALVLCWIKIIIQKPRKVLKIIVVVFAIISFGILLIWCVTETIKIVEKNEELVQIAYNSLETKLEHFSGLPKYKQIYIDTTLNTIAVIRNKEAEAITTHILTVLIYVVGVFVSFVIIYSIVDGFDRVVHSLEKIAVNSEGATKEQSDELSETSQDKQV